MNRFIGDFPSKSKHIASKIKLWEGVIHTSEGVIHAIFGVGTKLPGKPKRNGFIRSKSHCFANESL